ncbi:hypothetical protein TNIN_30051 [Trichonephila inaurata madagascariensis]|uniref:Uncharacterized protein n=1 Tax=Trichonephila inaurata madagascariensis TaxID=2747483 RepID=A0A8X6WWI0_9ARAC|nr:hypothetical protein TNIN_30051 [Trichonephila inaurata madagascariensis]
MTIVRHRSSNCPSGWTQKFPRKIKTEREKEVPQKEAGLSKGTLSLSLGYCEDEGIGPPPKGRRIYVHISITTVSKNLQRYPFTIGQVLTLLLTGTTGSSEECRRHLGTKKLVTYGELQWTLLVDAALKIPDYSNLSLFWKNKNSKEASIRKEKGEKSVYTTSFFDRLAAVVNTCPKMKKLLNLGSKTASSSQSNRNFLSRGLKDHMPIDHHREKKLIYRQNVFVNNKKTSNYVFTKGGPRCPEADMIISVHLKRLKHISILSETKPVTLRPPAHPHRGIRRKRPPIKLKRIPKRP